MKDIRVEQKGREGRARRAGARRSRSRRPAIYATAALGVAALATAAVLVVAGRDGEEHPSGSTVPAGASAVAVPGAGEEFDGCRFVGREDAERVLGGPVRQVEKPTTGLAAATCVWEVDDPESPRSLQLSVYRGADLYGRDGFEGNETFEAVDGVGDDAFFVAPSALQLHVLAGDHSVLVAVAGVPGDEPGGREALKGHMKTLAGRVVAWL